MKVKLEINGVSFDCLKTEMIVNGENIKAWFVKSTLKNGVFCEYRCPNDWGLTRLVQFIESILTYV